jgi:hypothetical protein
MPWVVGIDEAGYGPNLGPLVQAAVALRLPEGDPAGWGALNAVVRRAHEQADGRLLIDDSKTVYTRGGFEALERGVTPLTPWSASVGELVRKACLPRCGAELTAEAWYDASEGLPFTATREELETGWERRDGAHYPDGGRLTVAMVASVVPAPRFNRLVDEYGSKGTLLSRGLIELLTELTTSELTNDTDPVLVTCDKHGGRHYYAPLLQEAFPDGWVVAERESPEESRYRVEHLPRSVTITFRPRADGDSMSVALASMLCKYLREVCMRQFNRFWSGHVPGIRPTAGYPTDAQRFYDEIRPAMAQLGLVPDQVWRKK